MFDGDIITYVLMRIIFLLLMIAIWGSVLWIWPVAMAALTLILVAMSLVVAD